MEAGRQSTRDRLVEQHMPLVRAIARRYARGPEPVEDLIQVGAIGLIKAVDRFDPARGTQLRAIATPIIEGEIRHHLRDRADTVRTPGTVHALAARARAARAELQAQEGRVPSNADLAAAIGATEEQVADALRAHEPAVALAESDAPAAPPGTGDDRALVDAGLRVLSGRERRAIELRYYRDLRQADIAHELGVSQAQVSRIIRRALARMRAELADDAAGHPPPPPERPHPRRGTHSGRLLVRMDPDLHRRLAVAAEAESVSLNAYITARLEQALEGAPPPEARRASRLLVANLAAVIAAIVIGLILLGGALAGAW